MATVVERFQALERRLASVERACGLAAARPAGRATPETAEPPETLEIAALDARDLPPPVRAAREQERVADFVAHVPRAQPAIPLPYRRPPRKPDAPPAPKVKRSLEVDFGRWMLSRLGALSLVIAAGFLFHYAAQHGLLGPEMRLALGGLAGFALVALGERLQSRLAQYAAALTGGGIAILYVCAYAGHALYGFFGPVTALALATGVTAGAVVQALRHRVQAVAGLAALGGFLAPALVLDLRADPYAILGYLLVLNGGLAAVCARTDWLLPRLLGWIATPLIAVVPLTQVPLGAGIPLLLANVAIFTVGPRLRGAGAHPAHTYVATALTALISWFLFVRADADGWWALGGALGLLLAAVAVFSARHARRGAEAELTSGAALLALAFCDAVHGWQLVVLGALLAVALLRAPWGALARRAAALGWLAAVLLLAYVTLREVLLVGGLDHFDRGERIVELLAAGGALAAIRSSRARVAGAFVAALGVGAQIATAFGVEPWTTLALLRPEGDPLTVRLLAGSAVALIVGAVAWKERHPAIVRLAGGWIAALLLCEGMLAIDGVPSVVPGAFAAALLLAVAAPDRAIAFASVGLCIAAAFDLLPPPDFVPFLNRRVLAIGSVLAVAAWQLRGRPERRAVVLVAVLLGAAELASLPRGPGGAFPWRPLWFDLRVEGTLLPFWNTRFLFLAGVAAAAAVASRRWRWFVPVAHAYLVAGLGAEAVGLVTPALRGHPLSIFLDPGSAMPEQLVLTGVVLAYGMVLVLTGLRRTDAYARRTGLVLLAAGAAKVSLVDLIRLGDLYRVGSFVVLGGTFLLGSYAYHRWLSTPRDDARGEAA